MITPKPSMCFTRMKRQASPQVSGHAPPCREEFDAYPVDEMMQILDGELVLTSPDGTSETYRAGDTFYMAKGTPIIWEIKKTLHKYFMITE